MNQPVIIEVSRTEGDNEISFAIRGSVEWLQDVLPFALVNLGFISGRVWLSSNEAQRAEMQAGIAAFERRESYQGKFVTVRISQEQTI